MKEKDELTALKHRVAWLEAQMATVMRDLRSQHSTAEMEAIHTALRRINEHLRHLPVMSK